MVPAAVHWRLVATNCYHTARRRRHSDDDYNRGPEIAFPMDASRNAHFAAQHVQLIAPADKADSELGHLHLLRTSWHLYFAIAVVVVIVWNRNIFTNYSNFLAINFYDIAIRAWTSFSSSIFVVTSSDTNGRPLERLAHPASMEGPGPREALRAW